ncbi:hypothetical protein M2244_000163 [Rhodoferax antarcticus]|nr:hypothetical protein [Rhodoferax antarcticus]
MSASQHDLTPELCFSFGQQMSRLDALATQVARVVRIIGRKAIFVKEHSHVESNLYFRTD